MQKLYLLDASGYIYRSYFAITRMTNDQGESTNALYGFIRSVQKFFKDFQPCHVVAVFDGPGGGDKRKEIYSEYKAHRLEMPGDLRPQMQWAREYCQFAGIPFLDIPGVEADDVMGSVATWATEHTDASVYICTTDKDMAQLVNDRVFLINTFKENLIIGKQEVEEIYGIPPEHMIDWLAITGDASDNVPGISGFGPKTATAMLQQFGSLENMLARPEQITAVKKRETVIAQAEVARISRQLVTIDIHVPFEREPEFFRLKEPNAEPLRALYSRMHFTSLLKELPQDIATTPTVDEIPTRYKLVDDVEALHNLVKDLAQQSEVSFGVITTDTRPMRAEIVGIGFCFKGGQAYYIPTNGTLGAELVLNTLKPLFQNPEIAFYSHNVKYALHSLCNHGIHIANIGFDTVLASYLLNSHLRQHSLDNLAMQYLGKHKMTVVDLVGKGKLQICMRNVPLDRLCNYCCEEVDYTFRLKHLLAKQLVERSLSSVLTELELPLLRVLAKMEHTGIYVDVPYLQCMAKEIAKLIRAMEGDIHEAAGELFNINSPKQLSEILYKKMCIPPPRKTATGHSTDAEVLDYLKEQYPICAKILEYRTLEKLRGTYLDALPQEVNPSTHRVHCTFSQVVAATGRLACQDPNLQNIPVRTEVGRRIRGAFRPQGEGWSYIAADYSQIELRVLAHFSGDPQLVDAFTHNRDVHAHTASVVFNVPLDEVTREMRDQAKTVNFGVIYGQQAFGLSKQLGVDMKTASEFIKTYFLRYHAIQEYLERSKESARATGKSFTISGRERLIPDIHSKNAQIRSAAERLAINSPLQGSAADLIKMAMLKVDARLKETGLKAKMILQIHDELLFEVADDDIEPVKALVRDCMENVYPLKVPLVADIDIGKNWEQC
jgi:DNA polymerase-1